MLLVRITSAHANKLEDIQQHFAALRFNCFLPQFDYSFALGLEQLKSHTLQKRRHHLDALFRTQLYLGSKFCPSVLNTIGIRVPSQYTRDLFVFSVCSYV
jgi:hypothetical protein